MGERMQTHFENCWRTAHHHDCAIAHADRLAESNRELTERLEAAEELAGEWELRAIVLAKLGGSVAGSTYRALAAELRQTISAAPVKPVAGEERTT